eukprot:176959-Chlamydomonas_euryale.AAC.2
MEVWMSGKGGRGGRRNLVKYESGSPCTFKTAFLFLAHDSVGTASHRGPHREWSASVAVRARV